MNKILVVDDSLFSRIHTCKPLREAGYEVIEAVDGIDGVEKLVEHQPDCVITDLLMPNLDGIGFLHAIKERGINVPTFVLTADIQDSKRQQCLDLGVVDFLHKPIAKDKLLAQVSKVDHSKEK